MSFTADEPKAESSTLPGSGEPIPSLEQRLSPSVGQEESDDEYGPALPPAVPAENNTGMYYSNIEKITLFAHSCQNS